VFGVIAESLAFGVSFMLHSIGGGGEPMEPPFNLVGTILQMPGLIVSNSISEGFGINSALFTLGMTFIVQALLWSGISFTVQSLRAVKEP
jgi:hypothetical protein